MNSKNKSFVFIVDEVDKGKRIDLYLALKFPEKSRSYIQKLIKEKGVTVNDTSVNKNYKLNTNDIIKIDEIDLVDKRIDDIIPQKIDLKIRYEDDYLIIISKSAGIVVHPAAGNYSNTIVNALLYYLNSKKQGFDDLLGFNIGSNINLNIDNSVDSNIDFNIDNVRGSSIDFSIDSNIRPGIVHRLDKDTSGLMVLAKNSTAQRMLSNLFKERKVVKYYKALVLGDFIEKKGKISLPLGRSKKNRKKIDILINNGRDAETEFEVLESIKNCTLLNVFPKTGRTHQIRVHFSTIGHPIIGDKIYGNKLSDQIAQSIELKRQFLHAYYLSFMHPIHNKKIEVIDELSEDLIYSLNILKNKNL